MTSNSSQSLHYEDEIDFQVIFKTILASKKILILTLLFFTILSIIYSLTLEPSYKTSTKLEIGYSEMINGNRELIETAPSLISDLKILLMKRYSDDQSSSNISMNSFEKKIISLETTSSSAENNENLLTEMINYIDERHSNFALLNSKQKKDEISLKIEIIESEISLYKSQNLFNLANIESEISFLKENMRADLEAEISKLESEISKLESGLPIIDQEISQLNQVIIEDSDNLNLLKNTTFSLERVANSPTLEQIISSYKSKIFQLSRERNNNISSIRILSQKLDALKKKTLKSDDLFKLEEKKKVLENLNLQSDVLLKLEQEKIILENQLKNLTSKNRIHTSLIRDIETEIIKPKIKLIISLGIIFGFIAGSFLIFINNFIKNYRESQA
jgi:hypothetical protein